jgi:hypothetical protein
MRWIFGVILASRAKPGQIYLIFVGRLETLSPIAAVKYWLIEW